MPRERIAFLGIDLLNAPTGVSRAIQTMVDYFGKRAVIVTDDVGALRYHQIRRAPVYKLNLVGRPSSFRQIRNFGPLLVTLCRILRRERANRICLNTMPQLVNLALILPVIKLLRRKTESTLLVYDYSDVVWTKRNIHAKLIVKLLTTIGVIDGFIVLNSRMRLLLRDIASPSPVYVVRFGVGYTILRLAQTPKRIAGVRAAILRQVSQDKECVRILFTGILVPRRRLEDLITAFSLLKSRSTKNIVLYIVGLTGDDENYAKRLLALAKNLNCAEDLRLLRTTTQEEVAYLYRSSDVFVFPAVEQSWGLAPLEAMVFGKPVIVSEESGVSEVLREKDVAIIVPSRQPEKLARSLESLVTDERKRLTLGRAAERFVKNSLTYRETGLQLDRIWDKRSQLA